MPIALSKPVGALLLDEHATLCPRVLDLSRSFSRVDRPIATGIDRVERAYWAEFSRRKTPAWAVVHVGNRYALLSQKATDRLLYDITAASAMPRGIGVAKKVLPRRVAAKCAAAFLRTRAEYFGSQSGLMVQLSARMPYGFDYFNVGHSNLQTNFFQAIRAAQARSVTVMLHDMIPLDFPDFVRTETTAGFGMRADAALTHANRIICNSAYTARRVAHYCRARAASPHIQVAHLGVKIPKNISAMRKMTTSDHPYYVCVGTIEPRKNHKLLFEVWESLVARSGSNPPPKLLLIGARGWNNRAVFDYLDCAPLVGTCIQELGPVSDARMFSLLVGASGLLFPSMVEGFGLPALEAAAVGTPVLCSDIAVFRELLGETATFLPTGSAATWAAAIEKSVRQNAVRSPKPELSSWEDHFDTVLGIDHPAP